MEILDDVQALGSDVGFEDPVDFDSSGFDDDDAGFVESGFFAGSVEDAETFSFFDALSVEVAERGRFDAVAVLPDLGRFAGSLFLFADADGAEKKELSVVCLGILVVMPMMTMGGKE